MKKDTIEIVTDALRMVLASDILYLYFTGAWYEPCIPVLIAELTILPAIDDSVLDGCLLRVLK